MKKIKCVCLVLLLFGLKDVAASQPGDSVKIHKAPAPLYRDPIYDGAADPTVVYNHDKKRMVDVLYPAKGELYKDGDYTYSNKRSVIQVAEIIFKNGTLDVIRDEPFDFWLPGMN